MYNNDVILQAIFAIWNKHKKIGFNKVSITINLYMIKLFLFTSFCDNVKVKVFATHAELRLGVQIPVTTD